MSQKFQKSHTNHKQ